MDVQGWNERYRLKEHRAEDLKAAPTPLLVKTASQLRPGRALDLACGTGRNSIWLAEHGWRVTAIDGARSAIESLSERALNKGLEVETRVADLHADNGIEANAFDLVAICYYLQHTLFAPAKHAVRPGGVLVAIVHTTEGDEQPTENRLRPGELRSYFTGWQLLHEYQGQPDDSAHRRAVSEIVARKPAFTP